MNAPKLATRIIELEAKTQEAFAAIGRMESALASALAEGGSGEKQLSDLERSKALASGYAAALRKLDQEYFDVASREYEGAVQAYNAQLDSEFQRIGKEAEKALRPLEKTIGGVFPDPRGKVADLHRALLGEIWSALQASFGEKYSELVPPPPAGIPERDATGRRLSSEEINRGWKPKYLFTAPPTELEGTVLRPLENVFFSRSQS